MTLINSQYDGSFTTLTPDGIYKLNIIILWIFCFMMNLLIIEDKINLT